MSEKIIETNGVELCTESFGNPADPAILLIMGASASMLWWDEEFCQRIADRGQFVIRYDNRDVGRSVAYELGKPQYTVEDMADDAVGVLDAYGISQAHVVGMSLGGMITQIVALRHPKRVLTLTLMMTSIFGSPNPDLPSMDARILAYHAKAPTVNWFDEQSVANYMVRGWRLLAGSKHPFDEKRAYKLATGEVKRAKNLLSMFNHALLKGDSSYDGRLIEIPVSALVIHGTEDPALPYEHGVALTNAIPGASLLTLEGTGHEIHYADWDSIINAILNHIALK